MILRIAIAAIVLVCAATVSFAQTSVHYTGIRRVPADTVLMNNTGSIAAVSAVNKTDLGTWLAELTMASTNTDLLTLQTSTNFARQIIRSYRTNAGTHAIIQFEAARGSSGTPLVLSTGDEIGRLLFRGYDTSAAFTSAAELRVEQDGAVGNPGVPAMFVFALGDDGTMDDLIWIKQDADGFPVLVTGREVYGANSPVIVLNDAKTVDSNAHGISDSIVYTYSAASVGINSFDADVTLNGTQDPDHYAGFQSRPDAAFTGTIARLTGFQHLPTVGAAAIVTNSRGYEYRDATNSGTITTQVGLYGETLTQGSTNYHLSLGNSDADQNLIHVGVTGDPILSWDESEDAFSSSKGLRVINGSVGIGITTPLHKLTVEDGALTIADNEGAGVGDIQTVLNFKRVDSGTQGYTGRIATIRETADPDQLGMGFYTKSSTLSPSDAALRVQITNDGAVEILRDSDQIVLDADDGSGFTTTLTDSATAARTLTLPDETGTLLTDNQEYTETVVIVTPGAAEDRTFSFTNQAITITEIRAVLLGSATPSVTWTVRHGTDRNATGAEAVTGGTVTTSTTTGSDVTVFNDATVVADSFLWLETTAQSGTVNELAVTIVYTVD